MIYAYVTLMAGLVLAILRLLPTATELRGQPVGLSPSPAPAAPALGTLAVAGRLAAPPRPIPISLPTPRQPEEEGGLPVQHAVLVAEESDLRTLAPAEDHDAGLWGPYMLSMDEALTNFRFAMIAVQEYLADDNNYARIKRCQYAHLYESWPEG